jgi:hypothetical protein
VGFGGNATPSGINRRIALVGLTVRSRTRDCAQPLLSETFKVGRPFRATNSFETFTRRKTSRRNQCFTSQRTVHKPFENLERIASRFIPRLKWWAFSVSFCKVANYLRIWAAPRKLSANGSTLFANGESRSLMFCGWDGNLFTRSKTVAGSAADEVSWAWL